jgi:hypothetical protein
MKITSFYISKKTVLGLIDTWLDEDTNHKIEIHPVRDDEFLVYYFEYDENDNTPTG